MIKEFKQWYSIVYSETYIFVIKLTTYKVVFVIAAYHDYHLKHINVKTVFLNRKLDKTVFVTQLTDYTNETSVCCLNKALYRLKQSSKVWYKIIYMFLTNLDFKCLISDISVFKHSNLLVFVYVDNILLLSLSMKAIDDLK